MLVLSNGFAYRDDWCTDEDRVAGEGDAGDGLLDDAIENLPDDKRDRLLSDADVGVGGVSHDDEVGDIVYGILVDCGIKRQGKEVDGVM